MSQELLSFMQRIDQLVITEKVEYLQAVDGQTIQTCRYDNPGVVTASISDPNYARVKFRAAILRRFRIMGITYQAAENIFNRWFVLRWNDGQSKFALDELNEGDLPNVLTSYTAALKPFAQNLTPAAEGTYFSLLINQGPLYLVYRTLGEVNVPPYAVKEMMGWTPTRITANHSFSASYETPAQEASVFELLGDLVVNVYQDQVVADRRRMQLEDTYLILN